MRVRLYIVKTGELIPSRFLLVASEDSLQPNEYSQNELLVLFNWLFEAKDVQGVN